MTPAPPALCRARPFLRPPTRPRKTFVQGLRLTSLVHRERVELSVRSAANDVLKEEAPGLLAYAAYAHVAAALAGAVEECEENSPIHEVQLAVLIKHLLAHLDGLEAEFRFRSRPTLTYARRTMDAVLRRTSLTLLDSAAGERNRDPAGHGFAGRLDGAAVRVGGRRAIADCARDNAPMTSG